nr:hypothetical protein [Mucilaginibacter sp. X5P1]
MNVMKITCDVYVMASLNLIADFNNLYISLILPFDLIK